MSTGASSAVRSDAYLKTTYTVRVDYPTCSLRGCTCPVRARGWCNKHYRRWLRTGDPAQVVWERGNPEANFWAKVDRRSHAECWPWTGSIGPDGYGRFVAGGERLAHRFAYALFFGPVLGGSDVDHMCHNVDTTCVGGHTCLHRRCVNPSHLRAIPERANRRLARPGLRGKHLAEHQRAKTSCPRGHVYDEANTYVDKRGSRNCRACAREKARAADRSAYQRAYYQQHKKTG